MLATNRHRTLLFLSALLLLAPRAAEAASFHELGPALDVARSEGKLVLVDMYAIWCAPCKVFDKALRTDDALAAGIDDFVFVKIDGEKGDGLKLYERFGVIGFPTYLLLDADGELIARWYGWSNSETFLDLLDAASSEDLTLEQTREAHAAHPSARGAKLLAHDAFARGEYGDAVSRFGELLSLEPERAPQNGLLLLDYVPGSLRSGSLGVKEVDEAIRPLLKNPHVDGVYALGIARRLAHWFRGEERERLAPYLSWALELSEGASDPALTRQRQVLKIEHALIVEKDKELALEYRRALLGEDWENDPKELNAFAWWCFGQKVNLEEADRLAHRALSLESEPKSKANILDTAAEIRFALGDSPGAVELIEQAIELYPSNNYLKQQRARFGKQITDSIDEARAEGN